MIKEIALLYHLNLNHYSLSSSMKKAYLQEGIGILANSIKVPCNLSLSGQDLETIYYESPKVFDSLMKNDNIKFHFSSFSHFLPSYFPEDIDNQLKMGLNVFKKLIPPEKFLGIGLFAEYDFPTHKDKVKIVNKYFTSILINSSLVDHRGMKNCPGIYTYKINKKKEITLICVHKNTEYRNTYHMYLREFASPVQVIHSIKIDAYLNNIYAFHIDFEAPIINIVTKLNKTKTIKFPPRYDLFQILQNKFLHSDLNFVFLNNSSCSDLKNIPEISSFGELALGVERNNDYFQLIEMLNANRKEIIKRNKKEYLEAINSDNFVQHQKSIVLEGCYKGNLGKIYIRKNGRQEKINHLLKINR